MLAIPREICLHGPGGNALPAGLPSGPRKPELVQMSGFDAAYAREEQHARGGLLIGRRQSQEQSSEEGDRDLDAIGVF